jgi:secondary thiamine-phosphate synthase enzyme
MKQEFYNLQINTNGQKLYEFTDQTIQWINENHLVNGMLNLSIQHTSASLIVQENADPDVQTDLINYFDKYITVKLTVFEAFATKLSLCFSAN